MPVIARVKPEAIHLDQDIWIAAVATLPRNNDPNHRPVPTALPL